MQTQNNDTTKEAADKHRNVEGQGCKVASDKVFRKILSLTDLTNLERFKN